MLRHRRNESDLLAIKTSHDSNPNVTLSANTTPITPGVRYQPTTRTTKEQTYPLY